MSRLQKSAIVTILLVSLLIVFAFPTVVNASPSEWQAQPFHNVKNPDAVAYAVSGNSPANIKAAYNLPAAGGQGSTIAIVDAYDNPNVASDLSLFSAQFSLPSANLVVHKMSSFIQPNVNWGVEISLDVQWAHAIAPNANILLVEARSAYLSDLLSAVSYAKSQPGVVAVSMSWGGSEFSTESAYDSYFTSTSGIVFFASSGDNGAGTSWPTASSNVVSVGGTSLSFSNGAYSESAWSGSGGGVSTYEPKPSYQSSLTYSNRAIPDVAYNADPNSGYAVYDSYGYGWIVVGGTSAGAPQWAAIQAIGLSATNQNFYNDYAQASNYGTFFTDITAGSNGFSAGPGYDLATGIGSPLTTSFGAPPSPDFSVSASPNAFSTNAGTPVQTTISVNALNDFTGTVSLTTAFPTGWTVSPSSNTITGSGSYMLTITPPVGTATGTYPVTVTGISGALNHVATVNVQITKPDFSLTANPSSLSISIRQGGHGTSQITVNSLNQYTGSVTLAAKTTTSSITFSFNKNPVTAGSSSTLTINVPSSTNRGTYTITVTGTDSTLGLSHQTTIRLSVTR